MSENSTQSGSAANGQPHETPGRAAERTGAAASGGEPLSLDSVMGIPVTVQVILGTTTLPVSQLMKLSRGAILPLDNRVGEPVDVVVNGRVFARGELVLMDDDNSRFGITLTEIIGSRGPSAN